MTKILLSKQKTSELKKQLKDLEKKLEERNIEQAKSGGLLDSWHETASFAATQGTLEKKVRELQNIINRVQVLPEKIQSEKAILGTRIDLKDNNGKIYKYRLVHPIEASPQKGLISIHSPLGKLLVGRKVGEKVEFNKKELNIIAIN